MKDVKKIKAARREAMMELERKLGPRMPRGGTQMSKKDKARSAKRLRQSKPSL